MGKNKIPELLCPAGDKDALVSAIAGGADAVYFGVDLFNARMNAKNFTLDTVPEAVNLCHAHKVKAYVTLNIAIHEKEIQTFLDYVKELWNIGVDAFIVSDFGIISLVKEYYPEIEIHASTQCTVHNLDGANMLYKMGAKRVVLARELDNENIEYISKNSKAETEIFVHGAHCMSVSGQCLMSYCMGGRSGNRGECAQPCRLPYRIGGKNGYFLSLKDMTLARHVSEICNIGASSLKIEGRMKSGEYVYGVSKIWRKLLDQKSNASDKEISVLSSLFSRQGFTDGYFMSQINSSMLGIRSEENKSETKNVKSEEIILEKPELNIFARFVKGEKSYIKLTDGEKTVDAYGNIVEEAKNAPMSEEDIVKNLSKFGNTPYSAGKIKIEKSDNIMIRVSSLNALRRDATEKLLKSDRHLEKAVYEPKSIDKPHKKLKTAFFSNPDAIPENARSYFDRIFVYPDRYKKGCGANGVCFPPVIFDSEWSKIEKMLDLAKKDGIRYALISNIGQIERAKKYGFILCADYRFNVFNRACVGFLKEDGFDSVILSPELSLSALHGMEGETVIAYGKIPTMTTHKCIMKDTVGCDKCKTYMSDRVGASFYVEGVFNHINVIYNSVPVYMADKEYEINSFSHHFIFTDETREECEKIIEMYKSKSPTNAKIKRIK